jgi:hypothetical protein
MSCPNATSGSSFFAPQGCSKISVFGTATLDLFEKAGFSPLFQELVTKLTEFCNKLTLL